MNRQDLVTSPLLVRGSTFDATTVPVRCAYAES